MARSTRLTLFAALALFTQLPETAAAQFTLERVVLVSRHGVRSPTSMDKLKEYTKSRTWPSWPVADGCLTTHGKTAASRMGAYYRREFTARGLFSAGRRPAANQVFALADVDQRTRETRNGLLEGFLARPQTKDVCTCAHPPPDPLFHPVGAKVCKIDRDLAEKAVMERAGGDLESALRPYRHTVKQLQEVLDCCQPQLCAAGVLCTLETATAKLKVTDDNVTLTGPIAIGSTVSEVFLLEYAENMPSKQVAWGYPSTPDSIRPFLKLHGLQFELLQRTKYLAKLQASALVRQVLETLRQTAEGTYDPIRTVPREAKLVIYVGHDTNLANIGGMLEVNWQLGDYLQNETPPAGAMAFELLRDKTGKAFVRMAYYSQTLDQMRNLTQLSLPRLSGPARKTTPNVARIVIPSKFCSEPKDGACSWNEFYTAAKHEVVDACIPPKQLDQ
jgi:4-phytase / acid phosphatase